MSKESPIIFSRSAQTLPGGIADFFVYRIQGINLDKLSHHNFYKETRTTLNIAQSFSGEIKAFIHELYFTLNQYYYFKLDNPQKDNKGNKNKDIQKEMKKNEDRPYPVQIISRSDFLDIVSTTNILKPCEFLNRLLKLVGSEVTVECGDVDKMLTNKDIVVSATSFKQFYSHMPYLCIGEIFSYFYFNLGFRIYEVPDLTLTNPVVKARWIFYPGQKENPKLIQNVISIDDSIDYTKIAKTISFSMDDNGDESVVQPVNPFGKAQFIESELMKTRFLTINGKLADKTLALRDSVNKVAFTPMIDFVSAIQAIDVNYLKKAKNETESKIEGAYSSLIKFKGEEGNYALFAGQSFIIALLRANAFFNNVVEYNKLVLSFITDEENFPELWELIKTNKNKYPIKIYKIKFDQDKGFILDEAFDMNFESFEMIVTNIAITEEPSDKGRLFRIMLEGVDYNIIKSDGSFDISNYLEVKSALDNLIKQSEKGQSSSSSSSSALSPSGDEDSNLDFVSEMCVLPSNDADAILKDILDLPSLSSSDYVDLNTILSDVEKDQLKDSDSGGDNNNENDKHKQSEKENKLNNLKNILLGGKDG